MFNVTEERVPPRACQPRGRVWNWRNSGRKTSSSFLTSGSEPGKPTTRQQRPSRPPGDAGRNPDKSEDANQLRLALESR